MLERKFGPLRTSKPHRTRTTTSATSTRTLNRFQIKVHGRTNSIQRCACDKQVVQFGEICLFRNHDAAETKLELRWNKRMFSGKNEKTDEFILLTPHGALMKRVVRLLSGSDSWDKKFIRGCVGDPWNPDNSIPGSAGAKKTLMHVTTEECTKVRSRRTHLNRNILERHGRTLRCPGCQSRGPMPMKHSTQAQQTHTPILRIQ